MSMINTITQEEVIKEVAPKFGISVSASDIDNQLRYMAANGGDPLSDIEFKEWYHQQLNDGRMSDSQLKEIIKTGLLNTRLHAYLADRVPTVMPQVHLNMIVVTTESDAQRVVDRLNRGEKFSAVAQDMSIDSTTQAQGGDVGWMPPEVSTFNDQIVKLAVNEISDPIPHFGTDSSTGTASDTPDSYYILMISETDPARQVDDTSLQVLKSQSLDTWYNAEVHNHDIQYNFDSSTYAWINWQLQKYNPPTSSTTTTGSGG